jgi:hypothetical protein
MPVIDRLQRLLLIVLLRSEVVGEVVTSPPEDRSAAV